MAFIPKDKVDGEAARLGVDISGLSWPQVQKVLSDARKANGEKTYMPEQKAVPKAKAVPKQKVAEVDKTQDVPPRQKVAAGEAVRGVAHVIKHEDQTLDQQLKGKTILISPDMASTRIQPFKYDEDLGEEFEVEEIDMSQNLAGILGTKDMVTGTYRIKGKTGRRVIATSTLPKQNAGIYFRPDKDMFPIVSHQGRTGYLWTHQRLSNVKSALQASGYYYDYEKQLSGENAMWYSAGAILTVDIGLVHHIFEEIERKERAKRKNDYADV